MICKGHLPRQGPNKKFHLRLSHVWTEPRAEVKVHPLGFWTWRMNEWERE